MSLKETLEIYGLVMIFHDKCPQLMSRKDQILYDQWYDWIISATDYQEYQENNDGQ